MQTPPQVANDGINYKFFILFLVGLSAFGSFVNDMYQPALPEMVRYFHTSVPTVQLGLTMGMIGLALGQFILGPVSDKYGRKPVLYGGLTVFFIGAVASVFSPDIWFFLLCRLVQGAGASSGYFLAKTIPADVFKGQALAKTMAVIGAINGFAPASAPVVGGFVADRWHWQAIFIILAVFAVVLGVFTPRLKETLPPSERVKGSVWTSFRQYLPLLKNHAFMTHVLLKGGALGLLFAYISAAPFIIEDHFGFSQTTFGLVMGGNAVFVAIGSMLSLKFKPLKKAALYGGIGLLASIMATAAVLFLCPRFWPLEITFIPMAFCLGMIFTVSNTLAMNEGREFAGTASAILGIVGYVFGATLAPLVGLGNIMHSTAIVLLAMAVFTAVYSWLSSRLAPDL